MVTRSQDSFSDFDDDENEGDSELEGAGDVEPVLQVPRPSTLGAPEWATGDPFDDFEDDDFDDEFDDDFEEEWDDAEEDDGFEPDEVPDAGEEFPDDPDFDA